MFRILPYNILMQILQDPKSKSSSRLWFCDYFGFSMRKIKTINFILHWTTLSYNTVCWNEIKYFKPLRHWTASAYSSRLPWDNCHSSALCPYVAQLTTIPGLITTFRASPMSAGKIWELFAENFNTLNFCPDRWKQMLKYQNFPWKRNPDGRLEYI